MRFSYQSGDRVLDGFTLKRGVGRGGFGEVYFAVSDGGKEVALKLLSETEVEIRGVRNCLNLKHPNLVHVYDVREDARGDTWIVMEYVLGESLAQVISRFPDGLPEHLAREWFLSLSRAVAYLHDQGVVHRDLKPANIFIENGGLKVGDYGLCKAVGATGPQTRRVGTVHYMAPEVGSGRYDKSVDIYACGVLLYEMLSGRLPFDGQSDPEILMKHLTDAADLTLVPAAYRPVLLKALDKDAAKRFQTMAEFGRAVEAAGGVKPAADPPAPVAAPRPVAGKPVPPPGRNPPLPVASAVRGDWRDRAAAVAAALAKAPLVGVLALVPYALFAPPGEAVTVGKMAVLTGVLAAAFLAGAGRRPVAAADTWGVRLRFMLLGLAVGGLAYWLDGWPLPRFAPAGESAPADAQLLFGRVVFDPAALGTLAGFLLYFGGVLGAGRWTRAVAEDRRDRLTLLPALGAAFWASVLAFLWPWETGGVLTGAVIPLVLAAVAAQAVAPWAPPLPAPVTRKWRYRR